MPIQPRPGQSPSESTEEATIQAAGEENILPKQGQMTAAFGDVPLGLDYEPKAEVRVIDGVLHGLVYNEWSMLMSVNSTRTTKTNSSTAPVAYHFDYRERFIKLAAREPGAPGISPQLIFLAYELTTIVWEKEMGLNYNSYSPFTKEWNEDRGSVKDHQGRQVFFMNRRPNDLKHNPECGFLAFEGLVMLDHRNKPIKNYPGAPLTLKTNPAPWLMEGLKRCLGMTYQE